MEVRFIQDKDIKDVCSLLMSEENALSDDLSIKMDMEFLPEALSKINIIVVVDNDKICAMFMLIKLNSTLAEFHSCIHKEYRGRTAISIALMARDFVFRETPLIKLITHIPVYNLPAYALARKVGMEMIGLNTKSIVKNHKVFDQHIFGFSKEGISCQQR